MAKKVYSVVQNTPGYMPDNEPEFFRTLAEARNYALELVAILREDGYKVKGSAKDRYWRGTTGGEWDLGQVIEIYEWEEGDSIYQEAIKEMGE